MNWLQQQLQNTPPPDTILHLGAGLCRELPHWLESGASRIVLVEPNPELLPELRARTEDHDSVEIISAAIAGQPGRGVLRLFNWHLLSSLREPIGLYESLPGLQQTERAEVERLTINQLLDQLDINNQTSNWLVIDTPGEEAAILDQLQQSDRLHHFARIFLSAGIEPLYGGAKSAPELLSQLQAEGYEPASQADTADADWPRHHLRLDRVALECKRLKAELAEQKKWEQEHKADIEAIQNALHNVEQVLVEAEKDRTEAEQRHQAELEARAKEITRLTEARDTAQQELAKAQEHHDAELAEARKAHQTELESARKELTEARDSSETQLKELQTSLAEAESARKKAVDQSKSLESALTEQKTTTEKLGSELHERKKDLARLTQARDEAQQKLTKAEAESKSLRQKITELEKANQNLRDEYQRKEALIDEEFLKAESQLELIKELVFKDKPV